MATSAQFTSSPTLDVTQISTANTNRDGSTGTYTEVCAGPTTSSGVGVGKRIFRVVVHATGNTTAGAVRFFISTDGGTNKRLIDEVIVSAVTVGASTSAFRTEVGELVGLVLPGGNGTSATQKLYASTEKAETFNILIESGTL